MKATRILAAALAVMFAGTASAADAGNAPEAAASAAVTADDGIKYGAPKKVSAPPELAGAIEARGFTVRVEPGREEPMSKSYRRWSGQSLPVVVTSDFALHTTHLFFDWELKFLEVAYLRDDLVNLTDALVMKIMGVQAVMPEGATKNDALTAVSYLIVGKMLLAGGDLAGVPEPWAGRIGGEVRLINGAGGPSESPIFGYVEDYSQYKPRGHYAGSEELQRYFRAMMWFGRMKFTLSDKDESRARRQTAQAIFVAWALQGAKVKGEEAISVWRRIYETTAFFAGKPDDLTPEDYIALMEKTGDAVGDDAAMREFMARARELRKPRILGGYEVWGGDWGKTTQGMTLFGQRFSPDSEVMQGLTFDSVLGYTGDREAALPFTCVNANGMLVRGFPRGLDVMAALGFARAGELIAAGGDDAYEKYQANETALAAAMTTVLEKRPEDLHMWRIKAVAELARLPEGNLPRAMKSPECADKSLTAALASWTELRHDNILYSKESYSNMQSALAGMGKSAGGPMPPSPAPPKGYVEPAPKVYAALAGAVEALSEKYKTLDYPEDMAQQDNFERFAKAFRMLETISDKELSGEGLTEGEYGFIKSIGDTLRRPYFGWGHHKDVAAKFMNADEDKVPVAADVHTDLNSMQVLEEAVGEPLVLFMACPVEGEEKICLGVVYSHYEFKRPIRERLTDEEWREMLKAGNAPERPVWMSSYFEGKAGH